MRYIFNLFARGFGRGTTAVGAIQWQLNRLAALYVGVIALCIFLAAHEKNAASWIFLLAYLWIVLNILPYIWAGFKALGRRYGSEWSDKRIRGATEVLLVFGAFPFFYTGILNTAGYQLENLVLLIAIISTMAFCALRWPEQKTAFTVVGLLMCTLCAIIALATVYNTIDRSVTDPVVLEAREDTAREKERLTKEEVKRYKLIQEALEHNKRHPEDLVRLTKDELDFYASVKRREANTPAAQVKSLISSAASAVTGEGSATTSTSASWLGKYWLLLVGVALVVILVIYLFRRRKLVVATTTSAASPAASNKLTRIVIEFLIGLVVTVGLYVWWVSDPGYAETMDVTIHDRTPQKLCGYPKFPKGGKLMFVLPDEKHGKILARVEGDDRDIDIASQLMVHGETKGRTFARRPDGQCVMIHWVIESGWGDKLLVPVTVKVMIIRYHGIGIMDWIMSQYYK